MFSFPNDTVYWTWTVVLLVMALTWFTTCTKNTGKTCRERKVRDFYLGKVRDYNNTGKVKEKLSEMWKKVMLILQGVCSDGKLYTVIWERKHTCGVWFSIILIREGFVGGFGGRVKIFCFTNANRKILNVYGFHSVCWGWFSYQSMGVVG